MSRQRGNRNNYERLYDNRGQHASEGGTITNINYQSNVNPLEQLWKHCSPGAAFNSALRFDPPRCAQCTRRKILQTIEEWIRASDTSGLSQVFWLHGGAGVGKSALAQSIAEKFQKNGLAASFFFFKGDTARNNGNELIPTMVDQFCRTFKGFDRFVKRKLTKNWDIFAKNFDIQLQELLIDPLISLKSNRSPVAYPRLVIIDGLDECADVDVQCELLRAIARAIRRIPHPLRFLITSRPEAHIRLVFDHDPDLQAIRVQRYNLSNDPDADMDISNFFQKEFFKIRRSHSLSQHLPDTWPDQNAISSLVGRSSGHFIFASTVIRYIRSRSHRPDDRLDVILRLRPPREGDRPYAQLDALYRLIFDGVNAEQLPILCLVLGTLYFHIKQLGFFRAVGEHPTIEELLEMRAGDLVLLLDPILSLVSIDNSKLRVLHKSLFDYLLDQTRSEHLAFDLARVHEVAATYILKQKIAIHKCGMDDFRHFSYHCRYATLNDTIKAYLRSLKVPSPRSVVAPPKTFPPWNDGRNQFMRKTVWNFLQTLGRSDLDPTGQVHEQYVAKWMNYFQSINQGHAHQQICGCIDAATPKLSFLRYWLNHRHDKSIAKMNEWKYKLDKLFTEWKPQNVKIVHTDLDLAVRLACITQEHNLFSAYVKTSFPGNTNAIASSLLFGDDFIHSYNFVIGNDDSVLVVQTYSRHDNSSFRAAWCGSSDVCLEAQNYLENAEKHLTSDLHQKYGLKPNCSLITVHIRESNAIF